MAEPVNVVFSITERGFDKILRDVEALRSDLEGLGVDMSAVQRRLNGIETTAVKTGNAMRNAGKESDTASKSARGWAESLTTVWARQFREAERAEAQIRKVAAAQQAAARSAQGGRNYQNSSTAIDGIIAARDQAGRAFSNQLRAQLEDNAKAAQAEATAIERATRATTQRTRAEYDLNRARKQRDSRAAIAEFDAEFAALERATAAQDDFGSPSTRYALYDVANAYTAIGAALAGVGIYAGVVGAEFQTAFTNVARTTNPEIENFNGYIQDLRNSLVQLSGEAPLAFSELSAIATLGNQLGIAEDSIEGFTSTVARFASVSGVSYEEVARSFGGIRAQTGLSEKYFENLGAAMSLVSVRSNATEAQIISLTREIASTTTGAGFAIDEVVGLAGALASLQVAPERARGVIDTYFNRLSSAVAQGGERLDAFARITGRTAEEVSNLVRSGQGVEVFRSVLAGLRENSADVVQLDQNLEALGLTGLRASNTFNRFINSLNVADESFANARQGFIEGAELNRQYAQTVDDLSSQFTIFINGINALVDAVSGGGIESLAGLLQVVNNVIFAFTEWVGDNRIIAGIIGFGLAVAGITGALFLVRAGLTAATAAIFAMRQATAQMGAQAFATIGTLRGLTGALRGVQAGAAGATGSLFTLRSAVRSVLASTGIGLLAVGLGFLAEQFIGTEDTAGNAALSLQEYNEATRFTGLGSDGAAESTDNFADSLGGAGKAAEEAAVKVRTLVDYVNDLNGVFRRSEDLRFGSAAAIDEITLKWLDLNEEIEKYQQQIRTLTADRKVKEYFLGIAEAYDDQLRAGQLREEIAKIDDELATAQAGASTELTGNTRAAIENRKVFRDLLGSYEDYVSALASAGASQEEIQQVISALNADFERQATNLGFNSGEIDVYGQRFQDISTIIDRLPRDVTVNFDPNPALQALNEYFAKAEEQARSAGAGAGENFGDGFGSGLGDFFDTNPFEPFEAFAGKSGTASGDTGNFFDGILSDLQGLGGEFQKAGDGFLAYWNEQFGEIGALFSNPGEFLPKWFDEQVAEIQETFEGVPGFFEEKFGKIRETFETGGLDAGTKFNGGLNAAFGRQDAIQDFLNRNNNTAYGTGTAIGSNVGGGIAAGIQSALNNRNLTASVGSGAGALRTTFGFSGGGYTGAGHWLEPAGVVHKGEYVVPKKHVDQRTGLPDANYVANLQRGKSAPKAGYATGGYVGGGGGPVELGSATIGALLNGLSVSLNVGQDRLAQSASRGNERLSFTGSN